MDQNLNSDYKQKPITPASDEISPINPKVLKFTENNELELINNDSSSNNNTNSENEIRSQISLKTCELSSSSSYYSVSKAPIVSCKRHGQAFIAVDTVKFRLTCKKCNEIKAKSDLEFLNDSDTLVSKVIERNDDNHDDNDLVINCTTHSEEKGNFYCDDCKKFICKECFAHNHRKHNSNLLSYMSNVFKNNVKCIIEDILMIKPKLEVSLDQISKMNEKIKNIREVTQKRIKQTVEKINIVNKAKVETLPKDFENIYNGLDHEVEIVNSRLINIQKKTSKYISELNAYSKIINSSTEETDKFNNENICESKKSKANLFSEIKKTISESSNLLHNRTPKLINEFKSKIENFNKVIKTVYNNLRLYENSIKTSISSGATNLSIIIRRFPKFQRKGLKYYKTSSLVMKVDKPIFLSGLGLCGIYVSSMKCADSNSLAYKDLNERGNIPIEILVSEYKEKEKEVVIENKLTESHVLYGVINRNDPVYSIIFKKSIFVKPDIKYLLTVNNLDSNPVIDIWGGEVNKLAITALSQNIKCNVTNLNFQFLAAEGIESDFNEFNVGIISNLIYQKID